MPYVDRDTQGHIIGLYANPQEENHEYVEVAFLWTPEPTPRDLLAKLDADNALTQRNLRETIMLMTEAFKVATNGAIDLSQVRGVQMVYAVEAEAEALREQVRAQL